MRFEAVGIVPDDRLGIWRQVGVAAAIMARSATSPPPTIAEKPSERWIRPILGVGARPESRHCLELCQLRNIQMLVGPKTIEQTLITAPHPPHPAAY